MNSKLEPIGECEAEGDLFRISTSPTPEMGCGQDPKDISLCFAPPLSHNDQVTWFRRATKSSLSPKDREVSLF